MSNSNDRRGGRYLRLDGLEQVLLSGHYLLHKAATGYTTLRIIYFLYDVRWIIYIGITTIYILFKKEKS
jgi:hypothetical protein